MTKISVIVPCFNEEPVLPELFDRMTAAAGGWDMDYEIICVDDGSMDHTWHLLQSQSRSDPRWCCLSFSRNFGHQAAISAGLYYATGAVAIIMDADLQDPPEDIVRLLKKWRDGYEVVYAKRKSRKDPLLKRILAWMFYRVVSMMAPFPLPNDTGDFCLLDRRVIDVLKTLPERNRYLRGLRSWCGFKQAAIEFERAERNKGLPQYTLRKSFKLAMDGLFSFSPVPLRLATYLGLWVSGFAFLGAVFTFAQKLFAAQLARIGLAPGPGFPTVVISILFLGGVQLTCFGILGEYVARIYDEVKGRPPWIIRENIGLSCPNPTNHQAGDTACKLL